MDKRSCTTEWAGRLANRTGWYGVQTRDNGTILIFILLLRGRTYYIDMCNRAATGAPQCNLDASIHVWDPAQELPRLEDMLPDAEVLDAWEFKVQGAPAPGGGVCITVDEGRQVVERAPMPRRRREDATDEDASDEAAADEDDNAKVVDTDDEKSGGSLASSSSCSSSVGSAGSVPVEPDAIT